MESAKALRLLVKCQIFDEVDIALQLFELALLLLLRLLLVFIQVLLPVVQALFIVLLTHFKGDEDGVVAAERSRLEHQISTHKFSPEANIGF